MQIKTSRICFCCFVYAYEWWDGEYEIKTNISGHPEGDLRLSEMLKSFLIIIKINVRQQNPVPKRQQGLLRPTLVCFIRREKRGGDVNKDLFFFINKNQQTDAQMMIYFNVD